MKAAEIVKTPSLELLGAMSSLSPKEQALARAELERRRAAWDVWLATKEKA